MSAVAVKRFHSSQPVTEAEKMLLAKDLLRLCREKKLHAVWWHSFGVMLVARPSKSPRFLFFREAMQLVRSTYELAVGVESKER